MLELACSVACVVGCAVGRDSPRRATGQQPIQLPSPSPQPSPQRGEGVNAVACGSFISAHALSLAPSPACGRGLG